MSTTGQDLIQRDASEPHDTLPRIVWMTVDKARAQEWLKRGATNRRLSPESVAKYARDMRAGHWKQNGDTVKINRRLELIDGQHRLLAIVEANVAVLMAVAWNVDDDAMQTIDTGRARTFGDALGIKGEKDPTLLAATLAWIYRYENGAMTSTFPISHSELNDCLIRHPNVYGSIKAVRNQRPAMPAATLAFVHYFGERVAGKELADEFVYMVSNGVRPSGDGLRADHPAFRLRERFLALRGSKLKLPRAEAMAISIKAWNFFAAGESITTLRWRSSGTKPEAFPVFDNLGERE